MASTEQTTEQIMLMLGRMEGKIESIIEHSRRNDDRFDVLEDEIKSLNSYKDNTAGQARVWGVVAGLISGFVFNIGATLIGKQLQ
jgi:hypothetical protein